MDFELQKVPTKVFFPSSSTISHLFKGVVAAELSFSGHSTYGFHGSPKQSHAAHPLAKFNKYKDTPNLYRLTNF